MDALKKGFSKEIEAYRHVAITEGFALSHPRAPEIYANLVAAAEIFLLFLDEAGAVTAEQSSDLQTGIEASLQQVFKEQGLYQSEQDEVERFIKLRTFAIPQNKP